MKRFLPLAVFLIYTFILFRPIWLNQKYPIPAEALVSGYFPWNAHGWNISALPRAEIIATDVFRQQWPWVHLAVQEFRNGNLPLWNPYNFSGMPLMANLQSHIWFPWTLAFLFLPLITAWTLFIVSVPLAGMFGMYLFLKSRGLSAAAAVFGGIAFSSMGFVVLWLAWGFIPYGAILLPWILWSIERMVQEKQRAVLASVVLLTAELVSGYAQVIVYVIIFSIVYFIWRLLQREHKKRILQKFFLAAAIAFLLSAVQLIPSLEAYSLSAREGVVSTDLFFSYLLAPQHLLTFFAPNFFGNPMTFDFWGVQHHEFMAYFGNIAFALAALRIVTGWKERSIHFFGVLACLALAFALIKPVASLLVFLHIPILSSGLPARTLFIVQTAFVILAAEGIDSLRLLKMKQTLFTILALVICIAIIWSVVAFMPHWNLDLSIHKDLVLRSLRLPTLLFVLLSLGILIILLRPSWTRRVTFLLILLSIFEYGRFFQQNVAFSKKEYALPVHPLIIWLKEQPGYFRYFGYDEARFDHNFATYFGLFSAEGFDSLYPKSYGEFLASAKEGKFNTDILRSDAVIPPNDSFARQRLLDLLSIRYILTRTDRGDKSLLEKYKNQGIEPTARFGNGQIYLNLTALPRAYVVRQIEFIKERKERIARLYDPAFNPREAVITNEEITIASNSAKVEGEVQISSYNPGKVVISVRILADSFLILTDQFYPGWQALIDKKKVKIYQANDVFRGVLVPNGVHEVVFEYKPRSVWLGSAFSLLGLIGLVRVVAKRG